jgi:succinate dehydrogenase/fumarate reductase flavoprotein subunit
VNRKGKRFVNEAHNYNDMMKPFFNFDPVDYERPNLPAWLVFDQAYMDKYALQTYVPGMPIPKWVTSAESIEALATIIDVDAVGLADTIRRFNGFAVEGVDKDFRRGESVYDHFYGDPGHEPNPNLGEISKGPYYALQVFPGAIGTKGGAKVNARSQVLNVNGSPIEGLYAAGNVMAGITGPGYPGAGGTIGAAMTFGYIAGRDLAAKTGGN